MRDVLIAIGLTVVAIGPRVLLYWLLKDQMDKVPSQTNISYYV